VRDTTNPKAPAIIYIHPQFAGDTFSGRRLQAQRDLAGGISSVSIDSQINLNDNTAAAALSKSLETSPGKLLSGVSTSLWSQGSPLAGLQIAVVVETYTPSSNSQDGTKGDTSSSSMIGGISGGAIVGVLLFIACIVYYIRKRNHASKTVSPSDTEKDTDTDTATSDTSSIPHDKKQKSLVTNGNSNKKKQEVQATTELSTPATSSNSSSSSSSLTANSTTHTIPTTTSSTSIDNNGTHGYRILQTAEAQGIAIGVAGGAALSKVGTSLSSAAQSLQTDMNREASAAYRAVGSSTSHISGKISNMTEAMSLQASDAKHSIGSSIDAAGYSAMLNLQGAGNAAMSNIQGTGYAPITK